MLQERLSKDRKSTGIIALVSDSAGSRLFAYEVPGTADNRKIDGERTAERHHDWQAAASNPP